MKIYTTSSFNVQDLLVNNTVYNEKFRQALTYAINRDRIVTDLFKGDAEVLNTIYTTASPYFDKNVKGYPYDPEKAKQLIAESGIDTSKEITLAVPIGNVLREQSADLIQQDLQAVGLNIKIQKFDFPTHLTKTRSGDYQLALLGFAFTIDPDASSYFVPGGSNNFTKTDDPKLTELFAKGAALPTEAERRVVYNEIQQYMHDKEFVNGLYAPYNIFAQSTSLKGGLGEFWEGGLYDVYNWSLEN